VATVIAVAQHKGGTGKTATVANLGAALAERAHKVLLVDIDPQASLTQSMGVDPVALKGPTIYEALVSPSVGMRDIVLETSVQGVFLAPSHIKLSPADLELSGRVSRETILAKKLVPVRDEYEFILIDCGPSLGLLTLNALTAADEVLIPIQAEALSVYGLEHLLHLIGVVRDDLNNGLRILGFIMTMYDARTKVSAQMDRKMRRAFGDQVLKTIIKRRVKLAEAPDAGKPITVYADRSQSAEDYRALAEEILERLKVRVRG